MKQIKIITNKTDIKLFDINTKTYIDCKRYIGDKVLRLKSDQKIIIERIE